MKLSLHCVLIFVFISITILASYSTHKIFINVYVSVIFEVFTAVDYCRLACDIVQYDRNIRTFQVNLTPLLLGQVYS